MSTAPAVRPLDLETLVLLRGAHPPNDGLCLMEAVAYIAGEPHSDRPQCACPVLGAFGRHMNDGMDDAGRQALKPHIPRLVGSRSTRAVELKRGWLAADWLVHTAAPAWLRLAGLEEQASALESLPVVADRASANAIRPALAYARSSAEELRYKRYAALKNAADAYAAAADAADAYAAAAASAAAKKNRNEVYKATRAAADAKLAPTKALIQTSALELLDRMLAVTE
jgi:hypothetical protein